MDLQKAARLVEQVILNVLDSMEGPVALKELISAQLRQDGRGVNALDRPQLPFLLLPLTVCESVCGEYRIAVPAAAANQLFMAAADILDDIEDDDSDRSLHRRAGLPAALNASTALIFLAERTLALTGPQISFRIFRKIMLTVNSGYLKACQGQHLDLVRTSSESFTERQYLKIASLKSASSIEVGAAIGALLGGAGAPIVARMAKFGYYLGMSAQLQNDLKGAISKRDIKAKKITLPVIFALRQSSHKNRMAVRRYLEQGTRHESEIEQVVAIMNECGSIQYTLFKSEYYKHLADEQLNHLKKSGVATCELEKLTR